MKVLPEDYISYLDGPETIDYLPGSFELCFRTAFDQANDDLKKRIAQNFADMIRDESDTVIFAYGRLFFRASDMAYMDGDDTSLVKEYLLGRLEKNTAKWLKTVSGIGKFLSVDEMSKFTDPLLRLICNSDQVENARCAQDRLESEWMHMPLGIIWLS